jgi:aminoglycoside 3'-phosphotransferase-1
VIHDWKSGFGGIWQRRRQASLAAIRLEGRNAMDSDRDETCAAVPLPASLSALSAGYAWARDTVGESGGAVYRLHGKPGAPDLFLKHGRGAVAGDIVDEMVRLRWLARHIPVPTVEGFVATRDEACC